jgi:hypothetical protein
VVLATLSKAAWIAVLGGYAAIILIAVVAWPRDVSGRRRAWGCITGLAIFFGLFVVAIAAWAADHVF